MKLKTRLIAFFLLVCTLVTMLPTTALASFAEDIADKPKENAMEKIEKDETLAAFKQGDTLSFDDDGYIGVPYKVSVYFDSSKGAATPGYMTNGATPVILYVVNADFERIGTDPDATIIKSMVERGYAVAVLDYMNNPKVTGADLDYSAQILRGKLGTGDFFADKDVFPAGTYRDNLLVPAGYDVLLNEVFFELDKHGTDGTLEKIVNVWNNDFRLYMKDVVIKWVHEDGTRKATQNGFDGSTPVWYSDAAGKNVDAENGTYIKVKHTKAEVITDCVKADGSPIDLNLYAHVLYPTNPKEAVPIMTMFSSAGYLMNGSNNVTRPQMQHFLFNGYAGLLYDYAWIPMGRNDHYGYFDGSSGDGKSVTGDNQSYATYTFNATQSVTAANRFVRYLALTQPDTYKFSIDKLGVFGISKAAWMTQLGAPALREDLIVKADGLTDSEVAAAVNTKINGFYQQLWLPGHHGETRYDNGITDSYVKDGFTVDGGELQPFAVYDGNEISSGAQAVYSSCGAVTDYIDKGYSPLFITLNLQDTYNTEYGKQNEMANLCRVHDVPSLWLEADIAHTFAEGVDYNHGVDTYKAFMDFFDYYLKDTPASVLYTAPRSGYVGLGTTEPITVKFIGQVSASEIEKITVTDQLGNKASGKWAASYGNTEWTFTPDTLDGSTKYTLAVPADMKGENGKAVASSFTATFFTAPEVVADGAVNVKVNDYTTANVTFTVPALDSGLNDYKVRVKASYGVNKLSLLDGSGKVISSVNVSGEGWYELDILDAIGTSDAGKEITLKLKTEYTAGSGDVYTETFDTGKGSTSTQSYVEYSYVEIDGEKAMKVVIKTNQGQYKGDHYYYSYRNVLQASKAIANGKVLTKEDLGRTFLITFRIYDTVARQMRIQGKSVTSKNDKMLDYDRLIYNFTSKKDEWIEVTVPYTVYETEYGTIGNLAQNVYLYATPTGDTEMPFYIDSLTVAELKTDLMLDSVQLVAYGNGTGSYKDSADSDAFTVGENTYKSWKEAISAANSGDTVKLNKNYLLTDSDYAVITRNNLTVDLNGYKLLCKSAKSPFTLAAEGGEEATLTVKNGRIFLTDAPLTAYLNASDKAYKLAFTNVYVGVRNVAQTTAIVSATAVNGGGNVTAAFTFTDSVIDVNRSEMAKCTAIALPRGGDNLSVTYTFKGGSLVLDSSLDFSFAQGALIIEKNGSDEYTTLLAPVNMLGLPTLSLIKDGEFCEFVRTGEIDGYAKYEAQKAAVSTEYGIIPEAFTDADAYPFAIFSDNFFITAKKTWPEALEAVIAYTETASGSTVQILLRADADNSGSPTRMYKINGTLVLDLGGKTLKSNSATLFEFGNDTKYTGEFTSYTTNVVFKNGTLVNDYGKIAAFENKTSTDKHYGIVFDNVNITVSSVNNRSEAIVTYNDSANTGVVYIDMTFTDCTFDFTDAQKKFTVIKASAADSVCNIKINGGKLISDTAGSFAFTATDDLDTVVYGKGSDGKYTALTLNEGESAGSIGYKLDDGIFYVFGDGKTESGKTTYSFVKHPNSTPYGMIPEGNDDRFVIFVDGSFANSADDWDAACERTLNVFNKKVGESYPNFGKTVYIVMRSDYEGKAGNTRSAAWNGNVVIDLMGNTFTRSGTMFESEADTSKNGVDGYINVMNDMNGGKAFETNVTLKNGSIISKGPGSGSNYGHIIAIGGNHKADKTMSYTFENIDFGVTNDPTTTLLAVWGTTDGAKMDLDLIFNNCNMVFPTDTATGSTVMVRNNTPTADIDLHFNGGTISGDLTNVKLCNNSVVPGITFGKYADKYTTLTVPTGSSYPTLGGMNEDGEAVAFGGTGTVSGTNTTYQLVKSNRVTKYGVITSNRTKGFVAFCNGLMISEADDWNAITQRALEYINKSSGSGDSITYPNFGKTVSILMLSDYSGKGGNARISAINGTLVFDLNGHTFTKTGTIFECAIEYTCGSTAIDGYQKIRNEYNGGNDFDTNVIVMNGTIASTDNNSSIIATENKLTLSADDPLNKTMNFTFENVEFDVVAAATRFMFLSWSVKNNSELIFNLNYNDCTFDYSLGTSAASKFITNGSGEQGGRIKTNVSITGGKIKGDMTNITMKDTTYNTFTYYRGKDGEYPIFELTAGNPPSALKAIIDEKGNYRSNQSYSAVSVKDGVTTYKLGKMCTYGVIEPEYNYEKGVPFVFFMNGKAVAGASTWANATAELKNLFDANPGATVTVYVQYDTVSTANPKQFAFMNGTVNVDLNGHSLTGNANTLFECGTGNYTGFYNTTINVFNGTIIMGKGRIAVFESKSAYDKHFNVKYEDVTFKLIDSFATESAAKKEMFFHWDASGKGKVTVDLDFINCTFNISGATEDKKVTVIYIDSPNMDVDVTVIGGSIVADSAKALDFFVEGSYSDLTMEKGESGSYPTSSMADGTVLGGTYATADGNLSYGAHDGGVSTLVPCNHTYDSDCDADCNLCGAERAPSPHVPSESWTKDENGHYKTCTVNGCGAKLSTDTHSGGEATCIAKAVCQFCGASYGQTDPDNHDPESTLKGENGEHWYECKNECGEKLDLDTCTSDTWLSNGTSHHKECDECGASFSEGTCSGGKADCINKAVCSTCNLEYGDKDATNHVGSEDGKWYSENNAHYKLCKCGEKIETGTCSGGKADCMNKAVCSTCNLEYGDKDATNHVGSEDGKWYSENNAHYKLCKCGEKIETGTCSGGKADCMNKAVCSTCNLEYGDLDKDNHVGNSENKWISDGTSHYQECDCGTSINEGTCEGGEADCMNKAVCATCGNEYGELDNANHGADESEWLSDGTSHWYACQNGCDFRFNEAECDGGKATCVAKAVCATCENEYGEIDPEAHNLAENRSYDDFKHWFDCKNHCGQHVEEAPHEGGEATCTSKAQCDCGSYHGEIDPENHAPAEKWSSDGKKHWHECENGCGNALSEGNCYGGEATCSERAICEECGNEYGETLRHIHDYKYVSENGKHFKLCISGCGERYAEESCYGGTANCTEKAICSVCGSKYGEIDPDNHIPSFKMKTDGTHHWYECVNCGEVLGKEAHNGKATCVSAATCYVCGATFGEIDTHGHKAGSSWSSDGLKHWNECVNGCGAKMNYASHTGGTATCTEKAKCSVCGSEYGSLAEHTYAESWTVYGNKHWHECVCGAKKDEAEHSYGEWTVTKEATATEAGVRESKCVCGETLTQSIPAVSKPEKGNSMGAGSVAAIALGATAVAGAGAAIVTGAVTGKKKKKQ